MRPAQNCTGGKCGKVKRSKLGLGEDARAAWVCMSTRLHWFSREISAACGGIIRPSVRPSIHQPFGARLRYAFIQYRKESTTPAAWSAVSPRSVRGQSVVSPSSARGQPVVSPWSVLGQSAVRPRSVRGQPVVSPWSVRGQYSVSPRSVCGQPVVSPWSVHCQSVVSPRSVRPASARINHRRLRRRQSAAPPKESIVSVRRRTSAVLRSGLGRTTTTEAVDTAAADVTTHDDVG